jgi:SAM-dependent methyltransferase
LKTATKAILKETKSKPDFGTYHFSTPDASDSLREKVKRLFMRAFGELPFAQEDRLKVADLGCGLGFLSCLCVEYFPNARVTGIDTFEHASLKDPSLAKAKSNAKILGFSEKIKFQRENIFSSDLSKEKFDLFVSNLVFHNFGTKRRRFDAYERLARWVTQRSYVVLGDLFFDYKADAKLLANLFHNIEVRAGYEVSREYKILVLSRPKVKVNHVQRF